MIIRILFLFFIVFISCDKITSPIKNHSIPAPDLLFSSIRNGQTIVLSDIDGNSQIPITEKFEDQWYASFVSKEGDIIYCAYPENSKSRSIYKYDIKKMQAIRITDDLGHDFESSLSNDGKMLVFISYRNSQSREANIFTLNLQTNKSKQITFGGNHHNPVFSPDDSKILFSESSNGSHHLSVIDTSGENYYKLEATRKMRSDYQISPSGEIIYFHNHEGILSCRIDGSEKTILVPDSANSLQYNFFVFSDSVIFYIRYYYLLDKYRFYQLSLTGEDEVILKESTTMINFGDCALDGTKILYQQFVNGSGDIILLDLETYVENNITDSGYHDHSPKFNKCQF